MSQAETTWSAWSECKQHWRAYLVVCAVAVAAALVVAGGLPRTWSAQVKIANENKETDLLLGLNNFASWAKSAISGQEGLRLPEVYGQLVGSMEFAEEMAKTKVEGTGSDYYHHVLEAETPWWQHAVDYWMPEGDEHQRVVARIHENVRSKVSSKYGTVVLQVTDQDPLVAAQMVDSARMLLQRHMAGYARDRAQRDLEDAVRKTANAQARFEAARAEYVRFTDSHADISSPKVASMEDHLQKEYAEAFSAYNKELEQYRRAKALVGKFSFTFAVIKNATVPMRPSGPATTGYVMAFLFIAVVFTTWGILLRRTMAEHQNQGPWTSR